MKSMLFVLLSSLFLVSCTYTPTKKRVDVLYYETIKVTNCDRSKLKISHSTYEVREWSCDGCDGGDVRYIATCEDKTWFCRQVHSYDFTTECIPIRKDKKISDVTNR